MHAAASGVVRTTRFRRSPLAVLLRLPARGAAAGDDDAGDDDGLGDELQAVCHGIHCGHQRLGTRSQSGVSLAGSVWSSLALSPVWLDTCWTGPDGWGR